jgi:hypothetical protein
MTHLDSHPLPPSSFHDTDGSHAPPHIPEWRMYAGTDRTPTGSEIERDQRQKAAFAAHLEEHRRRGEAPTVVEEI